MAGTIRRKSTMRQSIVSARRKMALEITDARPTARPEIVEVVLSATGKPMRLRRSMVEFSIGCVLIPRWLANKVFA